MDIQAKAKPEAQLGDHEAKAVNLGGSVVASPTKSLIHPIESIQSFGSIASIHPKKATFPIGIAFSAHHH